MLTLSYLLQITTVLQKIHLKTDFISTAIPSSTKGKFEGIKNPIMHWSAIDHAKPYQRV